MKLLNLSILAGTIFGLTSCVQLTQQVSGTEETGILASSTLKTRLAMSDNSCNLDSNYDPGCSSSSLPVFSMPSCGSTAHAAQPILTLPADVDLDTCHVQVLSLDEVTFTYEDADWRQTCVQNVNGDHECAGIYAYASLTPDQELSMPIGTQAVITLSCTGYQDSSMDLVMSTQMPMNYAFPSCAPPPGGGGEVGIGE